jgi:predicted metal-binding membrane protein
MRSLAIPRLESATAALAKPRATLVPPLLLAGLAWGLLAGPLGSQASMNPGLPMFLGCWVLMTVAMMVPATLPVLVLHRRTTARLGLGPTPTLTFLTGYLLAWSSIGVVAFVVDRGVQSLVMETGAPAAYLAAVVLVLAGTYQVSPVKAACLKACRNPLTVLFELGPGLGLDRELIAGIRHGAWCVACCWALMAVLLLAAAMSLVWMALLSIVLLIEKGHPSGPGAARLVGSALLVLAAALLIHPGLVELLGAGGI